ncbi:hypothetical protein PSTT_13604 [Puccinia striiformis]|uniref:Uncharacterized protein n=2 Tax=Puccinia striiformis TaxID=27350 RepID=A0A0L0URW8_9BASI|nr:hypothetical protein PSTG_17073 [Puccinia striiformis f. sp. tritici PST-78]POV99772.1 hypothetical protein PSTT_13604 [Puccinia striiformis]
MVLSREVWHHLRGNTAGQNNCEIDARVDPLLRVQIVYLCLATITNILNGGDHNVSQWDQIDAQLHTNCGLSMNYTNSHLAVPVMSSAPIGVPSVPPTALLVTSRPCPATRMQTNPVTAQPTQTSPRGRVSSRPDTGASKPPRRSRPGPLLAHQQPCRPWWDPPSRTSPQSVITGRPECALHRHGCALGGARLTLAGRPGCARAPGRSTLGDWGVPSDPVCTVTYQMFVATCFCASRGEIKGLKS